MVLIRWPQIKWNTLILTICRRRKSSEPQRRASVISVLVISFDIQLLVYPLFWKKMIVCKPNTFSCHVVIFHQTSLDQYIQPRVINFLTLNPILPFHFFLVLSAVICYVGVGEKWLLSHYKARLCCSWPSAVEMGNGKASYEDPWKRWIYNIVRETFSVLFFFLWIFCMKKLMVA